MDVKQLIEKWSEVIDEGNPIANERIKKATAIMLENEHNYLVEAGTSWSGSHLGTTTGTGSYTTSGVFDKIAVPMVRRTFPELLAHQIVGVQPMTGPVGLAFALRFTGGTTNLTYAADTGVELGYNTIDNFYSGTGTYNATPSGTGMATASGEALGSNTGTAGTVGSDIGLGIGTAAANHIKEVNMTVEKAQVEAATRKLRSRWSLEVAQDLKAMHGLDLEEEMMDILAYEITAEIDRELVYRIDSVATSSTWNYTASGSYKGRWEMERYRELYHFMIRKSNEIARLTRRGSANFVVADPDCSAVLESLADFTIAPVPSDVTTAVTGVARLGSLGGRMTVYRDTFTSTDQMILGYKGPSEYDTGIIYLPYIQLLAARSTFEDSFQPSIGLMSRYAIHSHIFGAANYYQKITVTNLPS